MRAASIALLLIVGVVSAEPKKPPKPVEYTSEAGRYRAVFPGKPSEDSKEIATPSGNVPTTTERADAGRELMLAITFADYPEGFKDLTAKTILDGVRDGLKGVDGKVASDAEVTLMRDGEKFDGRELKIEAGSKAIRCRTFLVGRRLYQVMATGTKSAVGSKLADDFLKSFELMSAK